MFSPFLVFGINDCLVQTCMHDMQESVRQSNLQLVLKGLCHVILGCCGEMFS